MDNKKNNRFQTNRKYFSICVYAVMTFCVCLLIYKFAGNWTVTASRFGALVNMLAPFLIAFLIVYFINPLTRNVNLILFGRNHDPSKEKRQKMISLIVSYVIFLGCLLAMLAVVIPQLITSITDLVGQSSTFTRQIEEYVNALIAKYPNVNFEPIQKFVDDYLQNFMETFKEYLKRVIPMLYTVGRSVVNWIINIVMAFIISIYLLGSKESLLGSMKKLVFAFFSKERSVKIIHTARECNLIFSSYLIGKALDSLIIGIICFICMVILRIPYALVISLFVGVTNMIPYFGPFIGIIPGAFILLVISPKKCIIFIILVIILQQFDGNVLGPKIIGDSTGLKPIWVIFAILVGGRIASVLGMFLGVPVLGVIFYLMESVINNLLAKKKLNPDLEPLHVDTVPHMSDEELGFEYED